MRERGRLGSPIAQQPSWSFFIDEDGAYGTKVFGAVPDSVERVVEFLAGALGGG